jgi:hypothetical protein
MALLFLFISFGNHQLPDHLAIEVGGSVKLVSGPAGFGKKEEYFLKCCFYIFVSPYNI